MAMVAVACTREEDAPLGAPSISFEQSSIEFEMAGGDQTFVLTSTRDWTATCAESWVGLSKVTGSASVKEQQITISVDPNDSYDRSATIAFVAGDKLVTKYVTVKQAGTGPAPVSGIFYSQAFKSDGQGEWEIKDVTKPDELSAVWTYNTSYGMVATAYDKSASKNYATESWILSPSIDLSVASTAHLQLTHAANYFSSSTYKNEITLWLQVEGEEGFTHQLEIPNYPSNSDFTYIASGDIDLQEFIGKTVRIGIKYLSTSTKAGTYEISDVQISTEPFETVTPEVPDEGEGTGTAEDPYDVTKALAIINAGAASSNDVYVKGIISSVKEVDTSYGNATYFISQDGKTTKELEIYRGYYLGGVKFSSADQIKAGDEVIVLGKLTLYNSTAEMTQGNKLYSLNGETAGGTDPVTPDLPEGTTVYANDFDKAEATKTYGSGSSWPYLDQFDGWQNGTGTGASTVEYGYKAVSARANSASTGTYSNYSGSGSNNLFFGTSAYFIVKKITLDEGRNYVVTFGSEKYLNSGDSNFNKNEFKLYVSNDGAKWVLLDYQIGSDDASGKWNLNTSETFTVGSGDNSLYLYFTATVASAYRLDDVALIAVEDAGKTIDFASGVALDGGESSGDDEPAEAMTIAQMIAAADNATVNSNEVYVAAVTSKGYVALEDGKAVYVYGNAAPSVAVGDKVTFKGTKTTYYGLPEITSPTTTKVSSGNTVPYPSAKDITSTFDSYSASEAEYITFVATVTKDGTYTNFEVEGATKYKGTLSHAPSSVYDNFAEGDKIRLTGFFNTLNTSKGLVQVIYVSSEAYEEGGDTPGEGGDDPGESDGSVSLNLTSNAATWKSATDATYGAGFYAETDDFKIGYYKADATAALSVPSAEYVRFFKGSVVKVESLNGKKIEKVEFTCTEATRCLGLTPVEGGGTATADTETLLITWTPESPASSMIAQSTEGQVRASKMTVYFSE